MAGGEGGREGGKAYLLIEGDHDLTNSQGSDRLVVGLRVLETGLESLEDLDDGLREGGREGGRNGQCSVATVLLHEGGREAGREGGRAYLIGLHVAP